MTKIHRSLQTIPENVSSTIMLDCDDVLLDWAKWFRKCFEGKYGLQMRTPLPAAYNLHGWLPQSHEHLALDIIREFNNDPVLFSQLEPIPGAVDFVTHARQSGYDIKVLTACSSDPASHAARETNLERVFGAGTFADIMYVDLGASKLDVLKRHPRSIWVDDLPRHVHAGYEAGHHGILAAASQNKTSRNDPENRQLPLIDSLADLIGMIPERSALRAHDLII
ncbi:hypothetical protein KUV57_12800 [Epibacterium sp. DP7N7-1]|nr:hypothetical protein [Epibacterium sp. DP7N7-1]